MLGASEDLSFREILRFSVPAFGAIICDPVMGFVGQVSTLELAALGPNMVIWGAAVFLLNCFVTTTTSRVARAHLAGRADAARRVISDAVWLSAACGAALGAAMYALRSQVFALFGLVGAVAATCLSIYVAAGAYLWHLH